MEHTVCIAQDTCINVHSVSGKDFIAPLPFQVSNFLGLCRTSYEINFVSTNCDVRMTRAMRLIQYLNMNSEIDLQVYEAVKSTQKTLI